MNYERRGQGSAEPYVRPVVGKGEGDDPARIRELHEQQARVARLRRSPGGEDFVARIRRIGLR